MAGIEKKNRGGRVLLKRIGVFALAALFVGCSAKIQPIKSAKAQLEYKTQIYEDLVSLPPPREPIILVVYKFRDQTGQYKPGTGTTGWSTAVTQGATSMLIKALQDAGAGKWFTVLERESLPNLLNERKIIRQTRKQYDGGDPKGNPALPPLLFAPIMLEGGIIAYESNLLTGGLGARYLGIGGSTKYQRDNVTIYLRAVSVKNGRIIKSVNASKTIFSFSLDGAAFKFIGFQQLLEAEAGFTTNEPPQMAVLEAIEKGVYSMIIEGVTEGLWSFEDPMHGQQYVKRYLEEKYATVTANFDENGKLQSINKDGRKQRSSKPRTRRQRQPAKVELPEISSGKVDGKVFVRKGSAQEAVSHAQLQLVDARGNVVQQVNSKLGGFYQFPKVPLGRYILRVSPEQVKQLNLKPPPNQRVILNAKAPVVSGMNFTVEPAPQKVSRAIISSQNAKAKVESPPIQAKPVLSARQSFAEKEESRESPTSENTAAQPKPPSPKAEPILTENQNPPSNKVKTTLSSPDDIRQMGLSWGGYLNQP
jgi:curli production assembly/transport component CsgG